MLAIKYPLSDSRRRPSGMTVSYVHILYKRF
jgi:hypothetical protein